MCRQIALEGGKSVKVQGYKRNPTHSLFGFVKRATRFLTSYPLHQTQTSKSLALALGL